MKKNFLLLFFTLLSVCSLHVYGQEMMRQNPEERAKATVDKFSETVTLTQEQKEAMTSTFMDFFKEMRTARMEQDENAMATAQTNRDTKVKEILNDDEKYTAFVKFMEENRPGRSGGDRPKGDKAKKKANKNN